MPGRKAETAKSVEAEVKKTARRTRKKAAEVAETVVDTAVKAEEAVAGAVEKAAETTRKARRKKTAEIWIQAKLGGEITVDEVLARIREAAGEPDSVYIKPEENKAFYVADGKTGYVVLW